MRTRSLPLVHAAVQLRCYSARGVHAIAAVIAFMLIALSAAAQHDFDYFDGLRYDPAIPTPASVLGYEIGEQFTRHSDQVNYLRAVADASDRVTITQYGQSHQRRPLNLLAISSPANLRDLDSILARNRELMNPNLDSARAEEIFENNPSLVWFSFTVHGNEPSVAETAMAITYTLAASTNSEVRAILDNVVVFIDPMLNPDGHSRYVDWYHQLLGTEPNANPSAAEHFEPWPSGRTNHYYFDLNRDWLWLVHPESTSRIKSYRQVRPHLHIDFHEQGFRSPFFFGAGDDPYNTNIPSATRAWVELYGDANAEVFDREGLVYATRERFDYMYPGYGKVLPVYHGAVGMLSEKAGHSRAGLAIEVSKHYTLTLRERAYHNWLLCMSNLETTLANRRGQLERFLQFFVDASNPQTHNVAAFIISADNDPALLEQVWKLCHEHEVIVETLQETTTVAGALSFRDGEAADVELPADSWIIRTNQPMGFLVMAVFERDPVVTDPDTYDLTAWSLPVAFGLDSWFTTEAINAPTTQLAQWSPPAGSVDHAAAQAVAVMVDSAQHRFPQAMGLATRHDLFVRTAGEAVVVDGKRFERGSLIIHRIRNQDSALHAFVSDVTALGMNVHMASTGFTTEGPVLGANANRVSSTPKVLLLRDEAMSSLSYGQHWHLLDVAYPIPHTVVTAGGLRSIELNDFNVLVLADGNAGSALSGATRESVEQWVRSGGTIVASGRSATWASRTLLGLDAPDVPPSEEREARSDLAYEEAQQRSVEDRVPGTQIRIVVDTTHPLAGGLKDWYGVIKRNTTVLPVGSGGSVIARIDAADPRLGGLISDRNIARIANQPWMTHHRMGSGSVICLADDVTLRGFQHGPMRLLLNAITYGR